MSNYIVAMRSSRKLVECIQIKMDSILFESPLGGCVWRKHIRREEVLWVFTVTQSKIKLQTIQYRKSRI